MQLMIFNGYRQLGVLDAEGKLVAICSLSDIVSSLSRDRLLLEETRSATVIASRAWNT